MADLLYGGDLLTSGHHATFTEVFPFLHSNATVKGKQTQSGDAALKRLLHRQNQPDLSSHMRGSKS